MVIRSPVLQPHFGWTQGGRQELFGGKVMLLGGDFRHVVPRATQSVVMDTCFNPYRTELVFQNSSHFQHWRLYCTYFGHRSPSLPQTWLLFRHGVLLPPTCLPGLESPQALRRIKSNAVLSLF